jgi:hypothetical protein
MLQRRRFPQRHMFRRPALFAPSIQPLPLILRWRQTQDIWTDPGDSRVGLLGIAVPSTRWPDLHRSREAPLQLTSPPRGTRSRGTLFRVPIRPPASVTCQRWPFGCHRAPHNNGANPFGGAQNTSLPGNSRTRTARPASCGTSSSDSSVPLGMKRFGRMPCHCAWPSVDRTWHAMGRWYAGPSATPQRLSVARNICLPFFVWSIIDGTSYKVTFDP